MGDSSTYTLLHQSEVIPDMNNVTEGEIWDWIHTHTPFSVAYALKWEGYEVLNFDRYLPAHCAIEELKRQTEEFKKRDKSKEN